MTLINIIITLVMGGIIGWVASMVMKTNAQMGMIANIVVGIVGTFLGFWLANVFGLGTEGSFVPWIVAVVGAVVLLAILKMLNIFK